MSVEEWQKYVEEKEESRTHVRTHTQAHIRTRTHLPSPSLPRSLHHNRAKFLVLQAKQDKKSTIIKAEAEAVSAEMIGKGVMKNPGYIELRYQIINLYNPIDPYFSHLIPHINFMTPIILSHARRLDAALEVANLVGRSNNKVTSFPLFPFFPFPPPPLSHIRARAHTHAKHTLSTHTHAHRSTSMPITCCWMWFMRGVVPRLWKKTRECFVKEVLYSEVGGRRQKNERKDKEMCRDKRQATVDG